MDRWIRGENSQGIDYTDRLSAGEELEKFVDYWKGVPGRQGLRTDWDATFRNRIRNSWKSEKGSTSYLDQLKGKTT